MCTSAPHSSRLHRIAHCGSSLLGRLSARVLADEARRPAVRSLDERYRVLMEHGSDLFILLDRHGRILEDSPSLRRTLGIVSAPASDQSLLARMHPDDISTAASALVAACHDHHSQATVRLRHEDGTWRWIAVCAVPMVTDTASIALIGRDMTDGKRFEAELARMHRLATVGQRAGSLLHDVNNMLMGIACSTALARQALPADYLAQEDLAAIAEATSCAASCTRAALDYACGQPMVPRLLDLNHRITELEPLLRALLGRDICLTLSLAPDLGHVRADGCQLARVLVNLALNARDAMSCGGTLAIETANTTTSDRPTRDTCSAHMETDVTLTVRDTGVGMDQATQERLFEPFFTTKGFEQGTGLGLATCKAIITQYGGTISITSALGQGTAVRVCLPRAAELPSADCASAHEMSTAATTGLACY